VTAEERARWRSHHAEHWRPIRHPLTGQYTSVKPAPLHPIPPRGAIRTHYTDHYQMVRDPVTGNYRAVKPQRLKPYAHQPCRYIPTILPATRQQETTPLIEDTPHQGTSAVVNRHARAEGWRITRATHHDRQEQEREAWRQTTNAIAMHWQQYHGDREQRRIMREAVQAILKREAVSTAWEPLRRFRPRPKPHEP
jgi:hypothetical protein